MDISNLDPSQNKKNAIQKNDAFAMYKKIFSESIGKQAIRKVRRRKSEFADSIYETQTILIENCFDSSVLVSRQIKRNSKETYVLRFCVNYSSLLTNEEAIII